MRLERGAQDQRQGAGFARAGGSHDGGILGEEDLRFQVGGLVGKLVQRSDRQGRGAGLAIDPHHILFGRAVDRRAQHRIDGNAADEDRIGPALHRLQLAQQVDLGPRPPAPFARWRGIEGDAIDKAEGHQARSGNADDVADLHQVQGASAPASPSPDNSQDMRKPETSITAPMRCAACDSADNSLSICPSGDPAPPQCGPRPTCPTGSVWSFPGGHLPPVEAG